MGSEENPTSQPDLYEAVQVQIQTMAQDTTSTTTTSQPKTNPEELVDDKVILDQITKLKSDLKTIQSQQFSPK